MAKLSYYEKLKDPRWQKLRLEVMQNHGFECEICMDSESPLNVHHKEYFKGNEPWEYEINQLSCLCESCHEFQHEKLDILKWVISFARLHGPENREELAFLLAGYCGIDYGGILSVSCLDDFRTRKQAYIAGKKANKLFNTGVHNQYLKETDNG